jgi:RNA polymerase sigma-70 factor, ECF subfamily
MITDAELARRTARGEEQALEALYERCVDGLYAFVFYRVGRDRSIAEDVVQETFLAALGRIADYDAGRGSFRAWLCVLSRNVIRKHLRERAAVSQGRELQAMFCRIDSTLAELLAALDGAPLSDELVAREQTREMVAMTIANLPDRHRTILERKYVAGKSLDELAGELGISVEAAKSLLARARRAFRATFVTLSRELAEETAS